MRPPRKNYFQAALVASLLVMAGGTLRANPITYRFTVATDSIQGTSGFLDFDFAPGNNSQSAVLTISSFVSDGSLTGSPTTSGGVSGVLPGQVTIDNSTQFNDYFHAFDFGTSIEIVVAFDGPAIESPDSSFTSGSSFSFSLFDSTGTNPLLTTDGNGAAFTVDINLDGSATPAVFPTPGNGPPAVTFQQLGTPEPGSLSLLGLGLAVLCAAYRRTVR